MRVNFVVNTTGITGGIRVVFEYANRLIERGHEVKIIYPYDLTGKDPLKAMLKRLKYTLKSGVDWFPLQAPVIRVQRIEDKYLPDADVVIATANETADWVANLSTQKGEKFYFIQHFEDWSRDPKLVEATWKLPLKKIVIASWLERKAMELGEKAIACITNGINLKQFYCNEKTFHTPPKILMMTHVLDWKGTDDGLSALAKVKGDFSLTLFGAYPKDKLSGLNNPDLRLIIDKAEFVFRANGEVLRKLYCDHDIFLSPSWAEGCQLPPMEAMACGCAVVATNVGGVPDYAVAGETALVAEPHDIDALAAQISKLLSTHGLPEKIGLAGQNHIANFTWDRATDAFEKALKNNL